MDLKIVLEQLGAKTDPNLLIGMETMDDAGVYRITDEIALVQTVDFITPLLDDPFLFGQIAAANALSDVYAKGGRPINAMNICCFPVRGLDRGAYTEILRGGLSKIDEAGAILVGGHTVKDDELKYGLSVTGVVHPKKVVRNTTSKPGDRLILTKPAGSGVIVSGARKGIIPQEPLRVAAAVMATLNKTASECMMEIGANAATDITGFGLAGHSANIVRASRVGFRYHYDAIPKFPETLDLIRYGVATGVTAQNRELTSDVMRFDGLKEEEEWFFFDPQTSGGLLISVAADRADRLMALLRERGVRDAAVVGEVFAADAPVIEAVR